MSINLPIPQTSAPFMFWCQKVLPLVYDDSLSYYEVLCKLVTYVNGLRDDVIKLGEDVSELNKLYNELAKLLDEYFNRGVQDSVNKKLDEMASNGFFDNILSKYITPYFSLNFDTTQNALAYHFQSVKRFTQTVIIRRETAERVHFRSCKVRQFQASKP